VFLGGWFCAGASMLIRAFEMGRSPAAPANAASATVAST